MSTHRTARPDLHLHCSPPRRLRKARRARPASCPTQSTYPRALKQPSKLARAPAPGEPGAKHWTNYARYDIAIEVDPKASRLTGTAKMTYVNRSPDDLRSLTVHLYQDMMRSGRKRTRNITTTDGFELQEVRVDGEKVRARARDTKLTVRLPEALPSGSEKTIEIDYAFNIPKAGTAPRMGYEGDKVIYLGYWYPQFAVYDDVEGWVADPYRGNGEFYMDYADYDIAITAPVGYIVRATGVLQNPC